MLKSSLVGLVVFCYFSSVAFGQTNLENARHQTAQALRASLPTVTDVEDVTILARIGDIEGTRFAARRIQDSQEKARANSIVAGTVAINALKKGQFDLAEKNILAMNSGNGASEVWLELSRRYGQQKRFADARRTVLYAASQVRREKNTYSWPGVAQRLCELGERAAARRLFVIAKKELLDPDPLWGSALDTVIEAAARCDFDDIAFETRGGFPYKAMEIWARHNRDDIARRFMERQVEVTQKEYTTEAQSKLPTPHTVSLERAVLATRLFCLVPLSEGQYVRGDIAAARSSWQELDRLLDANEDAPDWFEGKTHLLRYYEASAQWDLADASIAQLKARLEKGNVRNTKELEAKTHQRTARQLMVALDRARQLMVALDRARLSALNVISRPEKFSLKQRQEALQRVTPLLLALSKEPDSGQGQFLLSLSKAQRILGKSEWRTTLQREQERALTEATKHGQWYAVSAVAFEWRAGGQDQHARALGRQLLKFWQAQQRKPKRVEIVRVLVASGLFEEALHHLVPRGEIDIYSWNSEVRSLVENWKVAPPQQLFNLAPSARHEVLLAWAAGLAPQESRQNATSRADLLGSQYL